MSWKETIVNLGRSVESLEKSVKYLQALMLANQKKLDYLQRIVEAAAKDRGQSIDRMADRLIEMAMVHKGMGRDAAVHRRSLKEEVPSDQQDLWQDSPETEWPPKGYDALNMP